MAGVKNEIDGLDDDEFEVSNVEAQTVEEEMGKGIRVDGELSTQVAVKDAKVRGLFYNSDGDEMGDGMPLSDSPMEPTGTDLDAGEQKAFAIGFTTSEPSNVAEYELILEGELADDSGQSSPTPESSPTGNETDTETETETETATPEPVDISFEDGWENGNLTDPRWLKYEDSGKFEIVNESGPDGGNRSLSISPEATARTQQSFRFDAPWRTEGAIKFPSLSLNTGFSGDFVLGNVRIGTPDQYAYDVKLEFLKEKQTDSGKAELTVPGGVSSTSKSKSMYWESDTWYSYEITHDGTGTYRLSVWKADETRPTDAQMIINGDPASGPGQKGLALGAGSELEQGSHFAFISFESNRDLDI